MTTEQFLALPDEFDANGNLIKQELIAGEVVSKEAVSVARPSRIHDIVKNQIGKALILFLAAHSDLGFEALVEIGFAVTDDDTFAPDVSVLKRSRLFEGKARILTGAPEISVEVVSPSDKAVELKHKTRACLANGSQSVWIVYPEEHLIEIHTREGVRELTGDQPIQDAALPGFSQPASSFFEGL